MCSTIFSHRMSLKCYFLLHPVNFASFRFFSCRFFRGSLKLSSRLHRCMYCNFINFRENFIFANTVKGSYDICDVKNPRSLIGAFTSRLNIL